MHRDLLDLRSTHNRIRGILHEVGLIRSISLVERRRLWKRRICKHSLMTGCGNGRLHHNAAFLEFNDHMRRDRREEEEKGIIRRRVRMYEFHGLVAYDV